MLPKQARYQLRNTPLFTFYLTCRCSQNNGGLWKNKVFLITDINERLVINIGEIVFLARYYFTEIFDKVKAKCAGEELTEKQNMRVDSI